MRFLTRSLAGLMLLATSLGLLGLAMGTMWRAFEARDAAARGGPPGAERVYAVTVGEIVAETARPVIVAYGDVVSARQLEIRARTGGTLLELAPGFVDGGRVAMGEALYRIDPADAAAELALAESDLAAAAAEEADARAGLGLADEEVAAAERQRGLRAQALARTEDLRARRIGIESDLEAAAIALSAAEQALIGGRQARAEAEARIARGAIARERAGLERDEAARRLADTIATAPWDGVLSEVAAVPGSLVAEGEKLALMVDPAALEVAFRVSNAEFLRIVDPGGAPRPLAVTASLGVGGDAVMRQGRIDRAGAAAGEGQTGRLIYARLDPDPQGLLRPGDFMTVEVEEPPLEGVAVLPAAAVSAEERILLLGAGNRLEEVQVTILRRQGDRVIVAGAPAGRRYVTERLPQLGPGIAVRPAGPDAPAKEVMVRLSPERRADLIEALRANARLPEAAKAEIRVALEADAVPQSVIDRVERPTGG